MKFLLYVLLGLVYIGLAIKQQSADKIIGMVLFFMLGFVTFAYSKEYDWSTGSGRLGSFGLWKAQYIHQFGPDPNDIKQNRFAANFTQILVLILFVFLGTVILMLEDGVLMVVMKKGYDFVIKILKFVHDLIMSIFTIELK